MTKEELIKQARDFRERKLSRNENITFNDLCEFDVLASVHNIENYRKDLTKTLMGIKERSLTEQFLSTFWYVGGEIIGDEVEFNSSDSKNLTEYGDFIQLDKDHVNIWNRVKHSLDSTKTAEYDEFPRGRVLFNTVKQRFQVVVSPEIVRDKSKRTDIIDWFHLPAGKTDFIADEHYIPVGSLEYEDFFNEDF